MSQQQGLPGLNAPLVDPSSGIVSAVWYRFLLTLFQRTGGAAGAGAGPIVGVTLTGSPYRFTAPSPGTLVISGGGVSNVTVTRDTVTIPLGFFYGAHPVSTGDQLVITYPGSAPSVSFIPT